MKAEIGLAFWAWAVSLILFTVLGFRLGYIEGFAEGEKSGGRMVSDNFFRYCNTSALIKTAHGVYSCYKLESY